MYGMLCVRVFGFGYDISVHVFMPCHTMPCHFMQCHGMSCLVLCDVLSVTYVHTPSLSPKTRRGLDLKLLSPEFCLNPKVS